LTLSNGHKKRENFIQIIPVLFGLTPALFGVTWWAMFIIAVISVILI
jgi:hypothetical protein